VILFGCVTGFLLKRVCFRLEVWFFVYVCVCACVCECDGEREKIFILEFVCVRDYV